MNVLLPFRSLVSVRPNLHQSFLFTWRFSRRETKQLDRPCGRQVKTTGSSLILWWNVNKTRPKQRHCLLRIPAPSSEGANRITSLNCWGVVHNYGSLRYWGDCNYLRWWWKILLLWNIGFGFWFLQFYLGCILLYSGYSDLERKLFSFGFSRYCHAPISR